MDSDHEPSVSDEETTASPPAGTGLDEDVFSCAEDAAEDAEYYNSDSDDDGVGEGGREEAPVPAAIPPSPPALVTR